MCRIDRQLLTSVRAYLNAYHSRLQRRKAISISSWKTHTHTQQEPYVRISHRTPNSSALSIMWSVIFPLMLIRLLAMQFIAFQYSRRTHLMHFIVLSLPLFPDQWSYCNVSRNFITVSQIERLRRVDTIEDGLHWYIFRCCRCRCRCLLTSHQILSPWPTRFYGSDSIRIFYYILQTHSHTLYWLLPQFISSTQWKAMHIGRLHMCAHHSENIWKHTNWTIAQYIRQSTSRLASQPEPATTHTQYTLHIDRKYIVHSGIVCDIASRLSE